MKDYFIGGEVIVDSVNIMFICDIVNRYLIASPFLSWMIETEPQYSLLLLWTPANSWAWIDFQLLWLAIWLI